MVNSQSTVRIARRNEWIDVLITSIAPVFVLVFGQFNQRTKLVILIILLGVVSSTGATERKKIWVRSSFDNTQQPSYLIVPARYVPTGSAVPLLVSLHTWSGDLEQRNADLERAADRKGWLYLFPNFRGANQHPHACGSLAACQDILDALQWVAMNYHVDRKRIYLTGVSGGGHMTMLMVGKHPQPWAAASAWVGISDLRTWHTLHEKGKYGQMVRKCCGGKPGASPQVDQQYRQRSPVTWLHQSLAVPLDIAAGVHDGHRGSVPVRHSINAFNLIARAAHETPVSEEEIAQLSRPNGYLEKPTASDQSVDAVWGRKIYLRRMAARSRVTIFEGGHEGIADAAVAWLERHVKSK
ncbi:MAG TPA: prolyl oligopeptidase [Planctomycetaceae bacterium]|nr:prolyl oligopeptidase [Planctomycetaceae bacterium]